MSWPSYQLDELGSVSRGKSRHRPRNAPHLYGGPYPFVQTADVKNANLYLTSFQQTYSADGLAQSKLWDEGTLCITIAANIADTTILGIKACFPDSIIGFIADPKKADVRFIKYYFDHYQRQFQQISQGATQDNLSAEKLLSIKIPAPPLSVQKKIAEALSAYDELIEANLKRIELLEEMAQVTYEEWFVRLRFPGYETTAHNPETGLPVGWEQKKVGNLLSKVETTPKIPSSKILLTGSIPVVDQSRDFIAGYTEDASSELSGDTPAIVFGDHTRVIKFINFPFARGADGTQIIYSNDKSMPQHLFYFTLINIDLSNYHYARHFKFLKDSEVIVPTIELATRFEAFSRPKFDLIRNLRDQNVRLKEARDLLLPRLITGLIDIDDYLARTGSALVAA